MEVRNPFGDTVLTTPILILEKTYSATSEVMILHGDYIIGY